jgi:hypothetical protein
VTPPPVAITVICATEAVSVCGAVSVTTALPVPGAAMLFGETAAVTPCGSPPTVRLMAELNPPIAVVRTVNDALNPGRNATMGVLDVNVIPPTITLTVVDLVSPSPEAVMYRM